MNNSLFIKNVYKTNRLPYTYRVVSKLLMYVHLHVRAFQNKWFESELRKIIRFFNKPSDLCHSFNHVRVLRVLLSFQGWASHSYHMFFGATLLKLEFWSFCLFVCSNKTTLYLCQGTELECEAVDMFKEQEHKATAHNFFPTESH